jgi:hypothetical protein
MLLKDVPIGYTVKVNISHNYIGGRLWWHQDREFDPTLTTVIATKVEEEVLAWQADQVGTDPSMSYNGYAGASYCSPNSLSCILAPP